MNKTILFSTLLFTLTASATIEIQQFDSPEQEASYKTLIEELRCPQCQNNNIADSNAAIATDMRNKTLELLKQGKNKQEVVDYMVARYGNFVTYDPPLTPATVLLWLMPALLILLGAGILFKRKAKPQQAVRSEQSFAKPSLDESRLNEILNNKDEK